MSAREVDRLKAETAGGAYPVKTRAPKPEFYEWTDRDTGVAHKIPVGIDPGWDYNVGRAAWGRTLSREAMDAWEKKGPEDWERLTPGNYRDYGRPERIPLDAPRARPLEKKRMSPAEMVGELKSLLGGEEKVFSYSAGDFRYEILVNAQSLGSHLSPDRARYLPFLPETLEDPYEVWLCFEKQKSTGRIRLRQRVIKALSTAQEKERGMLAVTQARDGVMESWTFLPVSQINYLNGQREGKLIWKR